MACGTPAGIVTTIGDPEKSTSVSGTKPGITRAPTTKLYLVGAFCAFEKGISKLVAVLQIVGIVPKVIAGSGFTVMVIGSLILEQVDKSGEYTFLR